MRRAVGGSIVTVGAMALGLGVNGAAGSILVLDYDAGTYEGEFASTTHETGLDLGGGENNDEFEMRAFSDTDPWSVNNAPNEPLLFGGIRGEALNRDSGFNDHDLTGRFVRYQPSGDQEARLRFIVAFEADMAGLQFDNESSLTAIDARRENLGDAHWLVRDGDQYYVSESTFGGGTSTIEGEDLLAERWALLDPVAFIDDFADFETVVGDFEEQDFSDLNRFGYLSNQSEFSDARIWEALDGFQAHAIPEPASLALLGAGGLLLLRRRRA